MIKLVNGSNKSYDKLNKIRRNGKDCDAIIGDKKMSPRAKDFLGEGFRLEFFATKVNEIVYIGFGGVILYGNVKHFQSVKNTK